MKQRLTLTDLASLLAEISGDSKKSSSDFLREFFNLVASVLEGGESVRIKGFGTFKLTDVESRKSVNIATGAEIEIPGHRKVSFVPSRELAEALNAAFEIFEPVELSASVTEAMLEKADSEDEDVETLPRQIMERAAEDVKSEDVTGCESKDRTEEEVASEIEQSDEVKEVIVLNNEELLSDSVMDNQDRESRYYEEPRPRSRFGWGFLAGFLTAAIIAVVMIVFFMGLRPRIILERSAEVTVVPETQTVASDSVVQDTAVNLIESIDSISVPKAETVVSQPSAPIGHDIVTKTRYLTTMSREYYGNYHFWVYIYDENKDKLGHPDRIRPGTRVVVPHLSKYGVDPKNPEDVEKAKLKSKEIYSRFK